MSLSKRQHALRSTGIGASEIAALAKASRYTTPIEIYQRKVGLAPAVEGYAVDLGLEIEEPIARVWAKRETKFLARVDTLRLGPGRELAVATPDRAVYPSANARGDARKLKRDVRDAEYLLQVKSTNWRQRHLWGEEMTDTIPDEFVLQAHWEGYVAGLKEVRFAVDFDKTKLHQYRVLVRADIFEALYAIAEKFWVDHVLARKPPPPDASDAYSEFLERVYPRDTNKDLLAVAPGSPEDDAVKEWKAAKALVASAEKACSLARQKVEGFIGENTGLLGSWGKVTWKRTKDRHETDWEAAAREALGVAELVVTSLPEGDLRAVLATQLRTLVERRTSVKPGPRMMLGKWQEETQALPSGETIE